MNQHWPNIFTLPGKYIIFSGLSQRSGHTSVTWIMTYLMLAQRCLDAVPSSKMLAQHSDGAGLNLILWGATAVLPLTSEVLHRQNECHPFLADDTGGLRSARNLPETLIFHNSDRHAVNWQLFAGTDYSELHLLVNCINLAFDDNAMLVSEFFFSQYRAWLATWQWALFYRNMFDIQGIGVQVLTLMYSMGSW